MIVTLNYNLKPGSEDVEQFKDWMFSTAHRRVLEELEDWMRAIVKYGEDGYTEEYRNHLQLVREKIADLRREWGCDAPDEFPVPL